MVDGYVYDHALCTIVIHLIDIYVCHYQYRIITAIYLCHYMHLFLSKCWDGCTLHQGWPLRKGNTHATVRVSWPLQLWPSGPIGLNIGLPTSRCHLIDVGSDLRSHWKCFLSPYWTHNFKHTVIKTWSLFCTLKHIRRRVDEWKKYTNNAFEN